jgi:histidinol-phosphate phosphatase family protein
MAVKGDRAIFLDKDGTLILNLPYNVDPDEIRLAAGAGDGLFMLAKQGYRFFVVSNQPGVALGFFPESALIGVERKLVALLDEAGVQLEGFYYCPHSPRGNLLRYTRACECRKPAPGLIKQAAREHGVSLDHSWMVGDILDDIEAGRRAGCRTVLIDNGNETEWDLSSGRRPHRVASDLFEAATLILAAESEPGRAGRGKPRDARQRQRPARRPESERP